MPRPLLILCLGNEIISDDGFGPEVARRLNERQDLETRADVIFAPVAGFALLDLLTERERVLIVDTIRTAQRPPGTLHSFPAGVLTPSQHLTTSHQISLPTALELGRQLGAAMPSRIDVLAVEAEDLETLQERLTPAVEAAVPKAVDFIRGWIQQCIVEEGYGEDGANGDAVRG